jgi:hypothetical protein
MYPLLRHCLLNLSLLPTELRLLSLLPEPLTVPAVMMPVTLPQMMNRMLSVKAPLLLLRSL